MAPTIINPRGPAGAGKTHFVRCILDAYGWTRPGAVERLMRDGRDRPIAYRLDHPAGGRPLAVLGHYEGGVRGGVDTIPGADGGLDEAFRLARHFADSGHDVLLEGLVLSGDVRLTRALADSHPLHVMRLATPAERCVRNLLSRRRAGADARAYLHSKVEREVRRLEQACAALLPPVRLEAMAFDAALDRAFDLLRIDRPTGCATEQQNPPACG